MESLVTPAQHFWQKRRVLITGHTGFKGGWLTEWLSMLGAKICGYSLVAEDKFSLFELLHLSEKITHHIADIHNLENLQKVMRDFQPEIVIHMAAQSLVRRSYEFPIMTYSTNVMGTAHVLESARHVSSVKVIVNVTTDKCYQNQEWDRPYREDDRLGGHDPYSSSKACSELVTQAYRQSFLSPNKIGAASARAGNVIGGGDWSLDRIIPDCVNAIVEKKPVLLRNPKSIRPWQHVLEPLCGYLLLAEKLWEDPLRYSEAWNFGPEITDCRSVRELVEEFSRYFKPSFSSIQDVAQHPHEAKLLKLDNSKAKEQLGWSPHWSVEKAVEKTAEWYRAWLMQENMISVTQEQIKQFIHREQNT